MRLDFMVANSMVSFLETKKGAVNYPFKKVLHIAWIKNVSQK